jgi:hypothetical protein
VQPSGLSSASTITTYRKKWAPFYIACNDDLSPVTATMAQPGHLEYQRASRHAPPQQVGEEPD